MVFKLCKISDRENITQYSAKKKVPELDGFHFHTLRHTNTANLLTNVIQPKDVQ